MRNRIIAVAVLVALVVLLFNLVTCVAGALGKLSGEGASAHGAPSAASSVAAASTAPAPSAPAIESAAESAAASAPSAPVAAMETRLAGRVSAAKQEALYSGVEDPWVASGRFTTGDAELDRLVKDFCDGNSTDGASAEENARMVFARATWAEFEERDNNQHPLGPTWDIEYAKQFFYEGSGNCYEVVALGEFILKYFGYAEAYAEPCLILRQSGSYGDHGLTYVTDFDGRKCVCDVAFGLNGFMLDADVYTVKVVDVGQDPSEFAVADFEEVVEAPWKSA